MTTDKDIRCAHELLDHIANGYKANTEEVDHVRKFLPERPKDVTLDDLLTRVHNAWMNATRHEWGFETPKEQDDWLFELRDDLIRILNEQDTLAIKQAKPAHPEFLETEADYENAPEGTIVACEYSPSWHKLDSLWQSVMTYGHQDAKYMSGIHRRVLRWGWQGE